MHSLFTYIKSIFWLLTNFLKATIESGWVTAKLILHKPHKLNSGIIQMPFNKIDGYPLTILGIMITLTPGSTLIDIDNQKQLLTIHLLDLNDEEKTVQQIEHDFIKHLLIWNKGG